MAVNPGDLGSAALSPNTPVTAGSMSSWRLTFTVGKHGIDDGGSIIVARRDVSDWELPQFDRPLESGYVTVETTGSANVRLTYDSERYIRPWRAALVATVYDGSLACGDQITITYGDTRQGAPGMRAQTFPESAFTFRVLVDAFGTGWYYDVPNSPAVAIIGGYPNELHVVAPSCVQPDHPFSLKLRVVDSWGNPSHQFAGIVSLSPCEGVCLPAESLTFTSEMNGVATLEGVVITTPGVHRIEAAGAGLRGQSNPIQCLASTHESSSSPILWGDLHGQTGITIGTGTVDEYLTFGRRAAFLDFTGWQGNDFQITKDGWAQVKEAVRRHHEDGAFVVFPGYEWSGLTPHGGDYNLHFLEDEPPLHRSSHWEVEDGSDLESDRYPIDTLWQEAVAQKRELLAVPHVGGRHANLDFLDERLSPVIEVHSHHGTFEWMIADAFARGYRVGFCAGSDDHTCRPGLSYPTLQASRSLASFDVYGGYTAVFTSEFTRRGIFDALFRRHCYATTGARILLRVSAGSHIMGDAITVSEPPRLQITVGATAPLLEVEVYRGTELIHRAPVRRPQTSGQRRVQLLWSGVRVRSRGKRVTWKGSITTSGGHIRAAYTVAFDRPQDGITRISNQQVDFFSTTSGDIDGVILDVSDDATLRFHCPHVQFETPVASIGWERQVFAAGGVNQRVEVSQTSAQPGPLEFDVEFIENELHDGTHPYWVRVVQEDGHMAWSSPIYITKA